MAKHFPKVSKANNVADTITAYIGSIQLSHCIIILFWQGKMFSLMIHELKSESETVNSIGITIYREFLQSDNVIFINSC